MGKDHSPASLLKQGHPRAHGRELCPDYPEYLQWERLLASIGNLFQFAFANKKKKDNRVVTLDFRRANLKLFKKLFSRVLQESAFEGLGVQECWSVFKNHVIEQQEQQFHCVISQASRVEDQLSWTRNSLLRSTGKKITWALEARAQAFQKEYRAMFCRCVKKTQKVKAQLDWNWPLLCHIIRRVLKVH